MANVIATVNSLEGKFFAKDANGNVIELKNGDLITSDMIVYGDKDNSASARIEMAMQDGGNDIVLVGSQEQAFDALAEASLQELDKDLYADADDTDAENEDDATIDDTAAGDDKPKQDEGGEGQFDARDGSQTDIVAGLRDAGFSYTGGGADDNGDTQKQPLNAEINIDGMTLVREGDSATYTLSVSEAPVTDLLVSVRISHIDTNSNDIITEVIVVTISAGETTGSFSIDNFDTLLAENDEDYSVTLISATGGGYDELTVGRDNVTTTIIDDDVTPEAIDDTASSSEDGREFVGVEDESGDARVATGNVLTNDTTNVATTLTQVSFGSVVVEIPSDGSVVTIDGEYGTLTIDNSGEFSFVVDDSDAAVDTLNIGDSVTDGFVYTMSDAQNPDVSATLDINIDGMDDAPVINSITANNQPFHTVDGLLDINGDSVPDYVSPAELLDGDGKGGLQFNENNGNITINMGEGSSSLAVDYYGGNAGYKNILGFYEKDADGNIVAVKVIYVDRGNDDGVGGNFDSFLGDDSISLGTLNDLSGEVGFFIVPNGYSNASVQNAIDNGFDVSIDPTTFKVIFTNPNDATDTATLNRAYYTDNDMSTDGRDHAIVIVNPDGGLTIGMEDLPQRGTDQDYDDVVFTIKPCVTLGADKTILNNITLSDVDDANLESAIVTLTNFQVGDVIDADNMPNGITATVVNGVVTLSGSASVSDYELALESLTFDTTSQNRDVREFAFTVFDGDKHSNTMEVSVDIGGCSLNTGYYENTTYAVDDYGFANAPQGEFEVASYADGGQSEPDTAALKDGGYVIAWTEESGRSYTGAEHDESGSHWATRQNHDVFVQRYDMDGEKVGEATLVNTLVTNVNAEGGRSQHDVNVVGLENGNYLVTWTSDDQHINVDNWDNGSRYIQGQIYDVNGNPVCEEFSVARAEYDPIVGLPDGGFIVTWSADARYDNTDHGQIDNPIYSDTQDGSGFAVVAQRFDALGNEVGDRVIVNQTVTDNQMDSDIVMLDNGTALMTWQSEGQDGDGYGVYAQKLVLTNNGLEISGAEIAVNLTTTGDQTDPEVTALPNGKAVITWESEGQGIVAQVINSDGSKLGTELVIADSGINPVITTLENSVVVVYEDNGAIYSKTFDADTTTMPTATLISDAITGQTEPSITALEDGSYVISWQDEDGISAHRYNANGSEFVQSDFDMNEDASITIDVATLLSNDYDIEDHTFSLTTVQNAVHGEVVLSADGLSVTFTPDADYNGPATFDYSIVDELGAVDRATVHLDVKPMGEPSVFVGTLCSADIHSTSVVVNEGEDLVFGVRLSGVVDGSMLTLALMDGSAIDTDYNEATYKYSFDGQTWMDVPANGEISVDSNTPGLMVKTDSVTDSLIENDENFTLSATLSSGQSAVGTGTILDVQTPPEADEVTTTSNLNSDDATLLAFSSDVGTPDREDIALFKKFDVGGDNLDGSGVENDANDSADLGGLDAQTLESNLVYEITQIASDNSYGDIYLEQNGIYTKVTDANKETLTFGNGDNVYWVATHDQVPTDGGAISLGGVDDFGSAQSVEASWSGVTLKALNLDGSESTVTYNGADGIGVRGVAGGTNNQIGYDANTLQTETMIVDFDNAVTHATIGITHLYNNASESEVGVVDAYLDGNKVGSFTFSNNTGNVNFTPDYVLSDDNIGSGNSGSQQAGYFSIDDLVFDQLRFSADPYVNQNGVADSSDYFLASIDINEVPDAGYMYKVIDESGLESSAVDVVVNVDTDTPMDLDEVFSFDGLTFVDGKDGFDTMVLEAGIAIDFSDDSIARVENIQQIDMSGNNTIALTLDDVLDMTEPTNSLAIVGGDTDSLEISIDSSVWTQTDAGDTTFSDGMSYYNNSGDSITLTVDEEINIVT